MARAVAKQLEGERSEVEAAHKVVKGLQARQTSMAGQLASLDADEVEIRDGVAARQKGASSPALSNGKITR